MASSPHTDPLTILVRYATGFFPLYDPANRFYWERLPVRAVIPVSDEALAAADRLSRRARRRFTLRRTHNIPALVGHLRDEAVKPRTWVRAEVVALYRALHEVGLLSTIEAYDAATGELAGGLLGLVLPGTFIAETMFSLVPEASKICLCQLVHDARAAGHALIDVQTPHHLDEYGLPRELLGKSPHPCIRLGEQHLTISHFLRLFKAAWQATFSGGVAEWLAAAATFAEAARDGDRTAGLARIPGDQRRAAWRMLRNNFPPETHARLAALAEA
jgi:leucyl/phenylalanyl-tRNA--protein transferase